MLCAAVSGGCALEASRLCSPAGRAAPRAALAAGAVLAAVSMPLGWGALPFFALLPGILAGLATVLSGDPGSSLRSVASAGWIAALCSTGLGSVALLRVSSPGPWLALLPLACCWAGDSAAYFTGCAVGRRRMSPSISPAKTWEGFAAGLAASAGIAVLTGSAAGLTTAVSLAAGLACGLAGVLGDLLESAFKRDAGVKDSGLFLPGHGGFLDRTDSLVLAAPAALAVLALAGALP